MARVLRVAFSALPVPERNVELRRVFGDDVHVTALAGQPEPAVITKRAQHLDVDAVVFDAAPSGAIEHLQANRPETRVLRPVFEQRETRNRYGYPTTERVFVCYGDLDERGEVKRLDPDTERPIRETAQPRRERDEREHDDNDG